MSQENVEIVGRAWAAWIKGDLDALFETFEPGVEWDTTTSDRREAFEAAGLRE